LNRDHEDHAERTKANPTYFPFTKSKNKHLMTRFEATSPEDIIKMSEDNAYMTSPKQERKPTAVELSTQLDKHE
jgi:hypothetical protein